MLNRSDQVERTAAAGSTRSFAGYAPSDASGAGTVWGRVWTAMPSIVIPTTKRHDHNPAPWPEEAVPR